MSAVDALKAAIGPDKLARADLSNLEDEMRREVGMRRNVFNKIGHDGARKMPQRQADHRIGQAERIVVLLEALQHPDTTLQVRISPDLIAVLTPELIALWLADPAAYAAGFQRSSSPKGGSADTQEIPQGASGTAREAPSAGSGQAEPSACGTKSAPPSRFPPSGPLSGPATSRTAGQRDLLVHAAARAAS